MASPVFGYSTPKLPFWTSSETFWVVFDHFEGRFKEALCKCVFMYCVRVMCECGCSCVPVVLSLACMLTPTSVLATVFVYVLLCVCFVQDCVCVSTSGVKNDFRGVPVSDSSFKCFQASLERVQRTFSEVLGCVCEVLGLPKTWIPYSTSLKNRVYKVFASNTPLGGVLEAF